jgi:ribosomal protein L2
MALAVEKVYLWYIQFFDVINTLNKRKSKYTMINSCWKGKALKILTFSLKRRSAGRNSSGHITVFHQGGGSK